MSLDGRKTAAQEYDEVRTTLQVGDARITDLARPLPMSFAAVSRHVGVLEGAGLVRRQIRGREHWVSVQADGLGPAERWLGDQIAFWSKRADALAKRLERNRRR